MKIQNDYLESKIGDPEYFFNRDSLKSVDLARLELSVYSNEDIDFLPLAYFWERNIFQVCPLMFIIGPPCCCHTSSYVVG